MEYLNKLGGIMPFVLVCKECELVVGCGDSSGLKKACNHGFGVTEGLILCTLNLGCAVSGEIRYVSSSKYPHECHPRGQRQDIPGEVPAGWGG